MKHTRSARAAASPAQHAAPKPRRGSPITRAPSRRAMSAEPSLEPLSTTSGWKPPGKRSSTHGSAAASSSTGRITSTIAAEHKGGPPNFPLRNEKPRRVGGRAHPGYRRSRVHRQPRCGRAAERGRRGARARPAAPARAWLAARLRERGCRARSRRRARPRDRGAGAPRRHGGVPPGRDGRARRGHVRHDGLRLTQRSRHGHPARGARRATLQGTRRTRLQHGGLRRRQVCLRRARRAARAAALAGQPRCRQVRAALPTLRKFTRAATDRRGRTARGSLQRVHRAPSSASQRLSDLQRAPGDLHFPQARPHRLGSHCSTLPVMGVVPILFL